MYEISLLVPLLLASTSIDLILLLLLHLETCTFLLLVNNVLHTTAL